jgi:hypothetical protein
MKYQSGGAFRRALEERLRAISLQSGTALMRLRKTVAFDRFLARLMQYQPDQWVVKGGLALQLRLKDRARTTKDMDLSVFTPQQGVYPSLKNAAVLDLGDWFSFEVALAADQIPKGFGGVRHPVRTLLDGRTFENFHIDVGVSDSLIEAADYLTISSLLEFAGLQPTRVPCFPIPLQIAEKLHAYTRPRRSGEPSRVKDFVDILLLGEIGELDGEGLLRAIRLTFQIANTHPLPTSMPSPPQNWGPVYERASVEVGFKETSLDQAFFMIQQFLDPVLSGNVDGFHWDSTSWVWKADGDA